MSECCQVWNLQFNDYPAMRASFDSQIVPVIGGASNDYLALINKPSINGVLLEGNKTKSYDVGIIATPSPSNMSAAMSSGIYVSSYSIEAGTITFACSSPPSSNVSFNVLTFPVVNSQ